MYLLLLNISAVESPALVVDCVHIFGILNFSLGDYVVNVGVIQSKIIGSKEGTPTSDILVEQNI